jgi:hypothetical protein
LSRGFGNGLRAAGRASSEVKIRQIDLRSGRLGIGLVYWDRLENPNAQFIGPDSTYERATNDIMIHEILLSLSGHPSPLLSASHDDPYSILSPPERALLKDLAHLSNLHYTLRKETQIVIDKHASVICQAVATSIRSDILGGFQRKILEVEEGILRRDAKWVGGLDGKGIGIVPLTSVVGEFKPWVRRLEWLQKSVRYMTGKTGAGMIDFLVKECITGYVDVEKVALGLVLVAEMAWLRLCSGWVLYGKLPGFGREDFFVQRVAGNVEVGFLFFGGLSWTMLMNIGVRIKERVIACFCYLLHRQFAPLHWKVTQSHSGKRHLERFVTRSRSGL